MLSNSTGRSLRRRGGAAGARRAGGGGGVGGERAGGALLSNPPPRDTYHLYKQETFTIPSYQALISYTLAGETDPDITSRLEMAEN